MNIIENKNTHPSVNKMEKTFVNPNLTSKNLKVMPLGGVEEIGYNSTAIEYNNTLIVIDMGLGFPVSDQHGVDYIIPNISYLEKNKSKLKGIFITHGHLDHIGGLPFVLEKLGFPTIYASPFARELIFEHLKEHKLETKVKIQLINEDTTLEVGDLDVSYFRVNHSIPESMGIVVDTPYGKIVHTGDFKFDNSPVSEPVADYGKIARLGSGNVLLLLSDSTNSFEPGLSISEMKVSHVLEEVVERAKGRVFVATFASLLTRIHQLIEIAKKMDRKVLVAGRSIDKAITIAVKLGYIKAYPGLFIKPEQLSSLPDNKVMILATGTQGENMAALARLARGEYRGIEIKKGDSVILSSSVIPGNGQLVQNLIDGLVQKGADVFHSKIMQLHSSGHGFQEDQKIMLNLVKPKYFMPVHGYQAALYEHAKTAKLVGIKEENIIIAKDCLEVLFDGKSWRFGAQNRSNPIFISGLGVGDVGEIILKERDQLANYGVLNLVFLVDSKTKQLKSDPIIETRGFVFVKSSQKLLSETIRLAKDVIESELKTNKPEEEIERQLINKITKFLYKETGREPIVIPIVILQP